MPVPLTTAALAFSAILALMGFEPAALVGGALAVINQAVVSFTNPEPPPPPEEY